MATLTVADMADLVLTTRPEEGDDHYEDIASAFTDYEVTGYMIQKDKRVITGGKTIRGNLLVYDSQSAKMVGLHEIVEPNIRDVFDLFEVPWRHGTDDTSWERREFLMNRGRKKIVNLVEGRRKATRIARAALLESEVWSAPNSSANVLDLWGIPYWVPKLGSAATSTGAFSTALPADYTTIGGIDPATYTGWRHWASTYTNVDEDDLLRNMRQAYRMTKFVSPVDVNDYRKGKGASQRIYVNELTIDKMESEMRNRNDRHMALTEFMGSTTFKKTALRYIPFLDNDTDNPVYMLDMSVLCLVFLEGDFFHMHKPVASVTQANTIVERTDYSLNVACYNRRRQSVHHNVVA